MTTFLLSVDAYLNKELRKYQENKNKDIIDNIINNILCIKEYNNNRINIIHEMRSLKWDETAKNQKFSESDSEKKAYNEKLDSFKNELTEALKLVKSMPVTTDSSLKKLFNTIEKILTAFINLISIVPIEFTTILTSKESTETLYSFYAT